MPDEKPTETQNVQASIEAASKDGFVEALAKIWKEEHMRLLQPELAQAVANARANIDRSKAVAGIGGQTGKSRLLAEKEQRAEWLRCSLARSLGRPATPRVDLDVDGLITQALNPITGASGAYLLPDEFIPDVEHKEQEVQVVWPLLQKRQTKSRTVIKPEVTTYVSANKGTAAEVNSATTATEITVTQPVYAEIEWNLEDFDTRIPIKLDLLEESPINVYDELIWQIADAFSINHEQEPLVGTGHTTHKRPIGLLDTSGGITEVATSGADSVAEILRFMSNIPQRYRVRATCLLGPTTYYSVLSVLAQNIYAAQYLVGALPPLKESAFITEGKILGGDFSRYVVYYIRLMQVIQSIAAERKTMELVVTETWTGQPTIADAFRVGTGVTYS